MAVAAACKEMCYIILCLCNIFISMENVLLQYIFISICIYLYIYVLAVILSDMRLVTQTHLTDWLPVCGQKVSGEMFVVYTMNALLHIQYQLDGIH